MVEKRVVKICVKHPALEGLRSPSGCCLSCARERAAKRAWVAANPEKAKEYSRRYYQKHKDKLNAQKRAWAAANPEYIKEKSRRYYEANQAAIATRGSSWAAKNPEKMADSRSRYWKAHPDRRAAKRARRRAHTLCATPAWANKTKIEEFYYTASMLGMHTGEWHHVDHIVPLKSKRVCGLHVEHNLQVLPGADNISKSNKHWPDMPV